MGRPKKGAPRLISIVIDGVRYSMEMPQANDDSSQEPSTEEGMEQERRAVEEERPEGLASQCAGGEPQSMPPEPAPCEHETQNVEPHEAAATDADNADGKFSYFTNYLSQNGGIFDEQSRDFTMEYFEFM